MEMTASAVEMVVLALVMECSSITVTMATISPLREGISLAATQPAGELFSLCLLRLVEAAEMVSILLINLRFFGGRCTRRGTPSGQPGRPHHVLARRHWEPRRGVVWHSGPHPWLPFWLAR